MQVVYSHSTGFVPYSGGAIGGAQAHIGRVMADGGQGVDADTVTAFFNLFPGQVLPASMLSFTDPFLGYKLDTNGRVTKLYSATGAAGDALADSNSGALAPLLIGSSLNGKPVLSYQNAVLYIYNLALAPDDEFSILGVVNDLPDSGTTFGYSPGYAQGLTFRRLYGNLAFEFGFYFGGPQIALPAYRGPNYYNRFNMSWKKLQAPSECVGLWNGVEVSPSGNGNSNPEQHFFGAATFAIGQNQNLPLRMTTLGLLSSQELTYRKPIDDFLKSYYGFIS